MIRGGEGSGLESKVVYFFEGGFSECFGLCRAGFGRSVPTAQCRCQIFSVILWDIFFSMIC